MSQTPSFFVNSPTSGTQYTAGAGYGCIPNNATSVTCTVKAWTGANGTGSLVAVTTLKAIIWNNTGNASVSSLQGSSVNTENVASSAGSNGTNIIVPAGQYTGSAIGSLEMFLVYTGSPVAVARVYRSGAWSGPSIVQVERSLALSMATGVFVYRSGVWTRAT